MNLKAILSTLIIATGVSSASAVELFSTDPAPRMFTFGARLGLNTSNKTIKTSAFDAYNTNSWGMGFDVGGVVNINFRDYLSVQPGFFFETRSTNFSYAADYLTNNNKVDTFFQLGHARSYNFTIPIVAQLHLNLLDDLQWLIDFGPYLQFILHQSDGNKISIPERSLTEIRYDSYQAKANSFDFGFKIGTGLMLWRHYSFNIHYLAGALNAWKNPAGGKNKEWLFTIGYDF